MREITLLIGGKNLPARNGATFVRTNPVGNAAVTRAAGTRLPI